MIKKIYLVLILAGLFFQQGCAGFRENTEGAVTNPNAPLVTKFEPVSLSMKTGQPEHVALYLYTRYELRFLGLEKEPSFTGFQIKVKKYEKPEEIERKMVNFKDRKFVKVRILEYDLTAQADGLRDLVFGKVKVEYREDPKFKWKPLLLDTAVLHVEVKK